VAGGPIRAGYVPTKIIAINGFLVKRKVYEVV